jgi:hypothetical protein
MQVVTPQRVASQATRTPLATRFMVKQAMSGSADSHGHCAMRGVCGTKGWFGQQLPCPYDGPAVEVSRLENYEPVSEVQCSRSPKPTSSGLSWSLSVAHLMRTDPFAARLSRSRHFK